MPQARNAEEIGRHQPRRRDKETKSTGFVIDRLRVAIYWSTMLSMITVCYSPTAQSTETREDRREQKDFAEQNCKNRPPSFEEDRSLIFQNPQNGARRHASCRRGGVVVAGGGVCHVIHCL